MNELIKQKKEKTMCSNCECCKNYLNFIPRKEEVLGAEFIGKPLAPTDWANTLVKFVPERFEEIGLNSCVGYGTSYFKDGKIVTNDFWRFILVHGKISLRESWKPYVEKTKEEIFFEQVKGKKIRCRTWIPSRYLIPHSLDKDMMRGFNQYYMTDFGRVAGGFADDMLYAGWEFYKEPTKEEIFFEQVKGKKIRRRTWYHMCYFIPSELDKDMMRGRGREGSAMSGRVAGGFEDDMLYAGWEFCKEPRTVKLYRYTYDSYGKIFQSPWTQEKSFKGCIKTEEKEITI